jgi:signal transduction histidine kinase
VPGNKKKEVASEILDSVGSGLIAIDFHEKILAMNRAFARRLGVEAKDWIGRTITDLMPHVHPHLVPPDMPAFALDWITDARMPLSREFDWKFGEQIMRLREDGRALWIGGKVIGRVFSYHDMSWERAIDQMKSEFISVASHELRTPLTSIKGSVDLILSGFAGAFPPEGAELLQLAHDGCERLIRLINDILDLNKIEAGQVRLNLEPMDLSEVAQNSIDSLNPLAEQNKVVLKLEKSESLPVTDIDKDRITQVFTNLISNAIKFSPPEGEVRVEICGEEGWVQCTVSDQGVGIPDDEIGRVFGKFQQLSNSRRKGGSGLGLAISHALVSEHGGRIWVESKVNEGARFTFTLPISKHVREQVPVEVKS